MWDNAIIFGVEFFVLMLIYIAFSLNKGIARYLGMFVFLSALFMQQWCFILMIDIATDAGKTAIATTLGKIYSGYPFFLNVIMLFYAFMIGIEILELYLGIDVMELAKSKMRRRPGYGEAGSH